MGTVLLTATIFVCITTGTEHMVSASQGQVTPICSTAESELGTCLQSMGTAIIREFLKANITNFKTPTKDEQKRMEHIATDKLCNTDAKQYVECTIMILRTCPDLILGSEMNKTELSKDIRRLRWFSYTDADSLCVCYKADGCFEEAKKLTAYKYSTGRGDQEEMSEGAATDLLYFGESLCLNKDQLQCAQSAVTKASCHSFLPPETYSIFHDGHHWLTEFLELHCTTERQESYRNSIQCISDQTIQTDECLQQSRFTASQQQKRLTCSEFNPIRKCIDDTIGANCGETWSSYMTTLVSIQLPRESDCPVSSAWMIQNSVDLVSILLSVTFTRLLFK